MKVGDLVKWTREHFPLSAAAPALVTKVTHYHDGTVVADVLVRGEMLRWNSKSCEVINASR
jgi:hypothetical protein